MSLLLRLYARSTFTLETFISPLLFLALRYWMADIFWRSCHSKMQSWSTTVMLFKNEYKVPCLPPETAAYLTVITEFICPILLLLGLAARFATIPMLVVTAVIQFTYLQSHEHFYWAVFLGLILCYGPGPISIDYFIKKKFMKNNGIAD
jgi:putative oxidoreductase